MNKFILGLTICLLFFTPLRIFALTGTANNIGGTTYYNFSDGTTGSSYNVGGITNFRFSDGTVGSAHDISGITFYRFNTTPNINPLNLSIDKQTVSFENVDNSMDLRVYSLLNNATSEQCKFYTARQYEDFKNLLKEALVLAYKKSARDVDDIVKDFEDIVGGGGVSNPYIVGRLIQDDMARRLSSLKTSYKTGLNKFNTADTYNNCIKTVKANIQSSRQSNDDIKPSKKVKIISDIVSEVLSREKSLLKTVDKNLTNRVKGRIILQVEENGEAWYVEPKTSKRHYMASGNEAYSIMRNLGVGITNKDLEKVRINKNFARKHSGKIFLQVEEHGEAYYIDVDGNAHYLKNGNEAFGIMQRLGFGISNNDIRKIDIYDNE